MANDKYIKRKSEQEFSINLGDIEIEFGKLGINEITHPIEYTHSDTYPITSDLISPYAAGTVTGGVPNSDRASISGNHGTDGGGGYPTAKSISTSIKIDGQELDQDDTKVEFEKVEMVTVNEVTNKSNIDLNTGAISQVDFIETTTYTFEHNRMAIEVELEAVNDFFVGWYMGLQLIRNGWRKDAYFNHDLAKTGLYNQTLDILESGTKEESPNMERVTMRNDKGDAVHVFTDKDYGIGYSKIRNSDPVCYLRENYQKMYFHLVKNGNNLIVLKGDKVKYSGAYIFGKNKAQNATNVTYFTEDGIKKAYVDFKVIATENIEYTSVEESFNCAFDNNKITSTIANAYAKLII